MGRHLARLGCGLAGLVGTGATFQMAATYRDLRSYPPPGRLVNIDGRRLHLIRRGAGNPTIVLEAGSGCLALDWSPILPALARITQVCAYDRPGYGWSDAGIGSRTIPEAVEQLRTMLAVECIAGPYILVGHSLGGLYMHYFARCHPTEVAGVILIDAPHPDLYAHISWAARRRIDVIRTEYWLATWIGLRRLTSILSGIRQAKDGIAQPDIERIIERLSLRTSFGTALIREGRMLRTNVPRLFASAGPFPDVPLVVLTPATAAWTRSVGPAIPDLWLEGQRRLARLSPQGRLIEVVDSGHMLHHDQPSVVIDVIERLVEQVREH